MDALNNMQKQYLSETVKKLSVAMKKIKFTRAMSREEADVIRKDLDDVKGSLFMFGDLHPAVKEIELFKQAADLSEQAVNALTGNPDQYL